MSHLDLVALVVRDYDAAIRFFVDVLQFEDRLYFVRVHLKEQAVESDEYPFSLPSVRRLDIEFASPVTFFVLRWRWVEARGY